MYQMTALERGLPSFSWYINLSIQQGLSPQVNLLLINTCRSIFPFRATSYHDLCYPKSGKKPHRIEIRSRARVPYISGVRMNRFGLHGIFNLSLPHQLGLFISILYLPVRYMENYISELHRLKASRKSYDDSQLEASSSGSKL